MAEGTVQWFNSEKGFGFVAPDDGRPAIYVHYSNIEMAGFRSLDEGQRIEFEIAQGQKGPQAESVRLIGAGVRPPPPVLPRGPVAPLTPVLPPAPTASPQPAYIPTTRKLG